jgi:hypothetical protein
LAAGRPKGSRNKLSEEFLADFFDAWTTHGKQALEEMATKNPTMFVRVAASLIPQHFKFDDEHKLAGLSDEELQRRLLESQEELAKVGITIDLEAKEVVVLPSPK